MAKTHAAVPRRVYIAREDTCISAMLGVQSAGISIRRQESWWPWVSQLHSGMAWGATHSTLLVVCCPLGKGRSKNRNTTISQLGQSWEVATGKCLEKSKSRECIYVNTLPSSDNFQQGDFLFCFFLCNSLQTSLPPVLVQFPLKFSINLLPRSFAHALFIAWGPSFCPGCSPLAFIWWPWTFVLEVTANNFFPLYFSWFRKL